MDPRDQDTKATNGSQPEGGAFNPMAMGMVMMKKMMGMCVGMCAEMLTGLRQTNALAVFATPELQRVFGEWLKDLESKAEAVIAQGEIDADALAAALKISEDSALRPRSPRSERQSDTHRSVSNWCARCRT